MARTIKLKRVHDPAEFKTSRYRVQLFSRLGTYARGTFCLPGALFHADDDIVFAVTFGSRWGATEGDLPYSEVDWLEPEVVRLLGAFMMIEHFPEGLRSRFYPLPHAGFTLNEPEVDLSSPAVAQLVKRALFRTVGNRLWPQSQRMWDAYQGQAFNLFDASELSIESLPTYWTRISTESHVLMRGVQALVKSDMLSAHSEFQEESTIATFIALDASHELVLRHLRASGIANPSSAQAGDWLYVTFDEPLGINGAEGLKYFEEFYAQRVQTVHPGSRFGDVPFAPVMIDDRIHLRQSLPQIFGYLVLGEHGPPFWREVAERKAWFARAVADHCE